MLRNSIVFDNETGIYIPKWTDYVDINNVTVVDCGTYGIRLSSDDDAGRTHIYNTLAYNCGTNYAYLSDTNKSHNASDDSDASSIPGTNSLTNVSSSDFKDYSANDFHIGSAKLKDAGTDLSAEGFSDDIDGQSRPGTGTSNWDIGADEVMVVGVTIKGNVVIGGNVTIGAY